MEENKKIKVSAIELIAHSVKCFALGFAIATLIGRLEEICLS